MLKYIYGHDLERYPRLAEGMFRDRARQFHDRQGWSVSVDVNGQEHDDYDDLDPLYVIWQQADGSHGGSMRFLPTTGPHLVRDHFPHLTGGVEIASPLIWECTRFCLAPGAEGRVAAALMVACGELFEGFSLEHILGVFDRRMERIYARIGATPDILGSEGEGAAKVGVGLWRYAEADREKVFRLAELTPCLSEAWFEMSFGRRSRVAV